MHIGQQIKTLVESIKMTPNEFAQLLGKKSRGSAYDIWDRKDINTKDLRIIAEHFGVSMSSFFDKKGNIEDAKVEEGKNNDELKAYLKDQVREKDLRIIELEKELEITKRKKASYLIAAEE
jgi:transcriptional regulator with XRE-family HTH domain